MNLSSEREAPFLSSVLCPLSSVLCPLSSVLLFLRRRRGYLQVIGQILFRHADDVFHCHGFDPLIERLIVVVTESVEVVQIAAARSLADGGLTLSVHFDDGLDRRVELLFRDLAVLRFLDVFEDALDHFVDGFRLRLGP